MKLLLLAALLGQALGTSNPMPESLREEASKNEGLPEETASLKCSKDESNPVTRMWHAMNDLDCNGEPLTEETNIEISDDKASISLYWRHRDELFEKLKNKEPVRLNLIDKDSGNNVFHYLAMAPTVYGQHREGIMNTQARILGHIIRGYSKSLRRKQALQLINEVNKGGQTPLDIALEYDSSAKLIHDLVKNGARTSEFSLKKNSWYNWF